MSAGVSAAKAGDIGHGGGYVPLVRKDLHSPDFHRLDASEYDLGRRTKRHGSMIPISEAEYNRLHFTNNR